jgi:hypothetical protein
MYQYLEALGKFAVSIMRYSFEHPSAPPEVRPRRGDPGYDFGSRKE